MVESLSSWSAWWWWSSAWWCAPRRRPCALSARPAASSSLSTPCTCSATRWSTSATTTTCLLRPPGRILPTASTSPADPPDASPTATTPPTTYHMGFELSPPAYLSMLLHEKALLVTCNIGANYASGGSGILDTTGNGTLTMTTQIRYFKRAVDRMVCLPSKEAMLAQSFFLLSGGGGNDFSAFSGPISDAPAYIAKMVSTYIGHIQELYNLGARMVGILDVLPIGCTPGQRVLMPTGECNEVANSLARWFNSLLRIELAGTAAEYMPQLKYSIANNYNILSDMMANPLVTGLREVKMACCGAGKLMGEKMCGDPGTTMCVDNHDEYMFWDMLHATEATIQRGCLALFHGDANYADPVNFRTLVTQKKGSSLVAPNKQVVEA